MNWTGCVRKWSCLNFGFYNGICVERQEKCKNSRNSWCPDWDL